jgi:diguanylate cyclase (GGDEF)-like protein
MIDVDHFKMFNDSQGHQAGDECLVQLGQRIWSACRSTDFVGRYGGEEFVVLAPETDLETATTLAQRIREAVWDLNIPHAASPVADRVTVCIGVAASDGGPWEDTVKRADSALYGAKHAGRNRVSVDLPARTPSPESPLPSKQGCPQGLGQGSSAAVAGAGRGVAELEEFAETLPHRVAAIEGALGERDYRMLTTLAAQLKDAAGGCGSRAFAELAAELEDAAATDPDFNQLTAQVQALIALSRHGRTAPTVL